MPTIAHVKGWAEFQHYRDRSPPWIKLHRKLLDNFEFARLPLASKALAPLLWLLAAETNDGSVRVDFDWLAFRLHITEADAEAGVTPLIDSGFLVIASGTLARRKHTASLEGEGEGEGKNNLARQAARSADRFADFWDAYPLKKGKRKALATWTARGLDAIADRILADVKDRLERDRQWRDGFIPHGSTYVNGAGWEDAVDTSAGPQRPASAGGRPDPVHNPGGSSPVVAESATRKYEAMVAHYQQQIDLGYMTREQAREAIKPFREARDAEAQSSA